MLSLDLIDRLLLAWDERLRRIDENLIAIESDSAYQMMIGTGARGRYDGISAHRLHDVQQELAALFADLGRLRAVIEQARSTREAVRNKLWGKDEKLLLLEGLLLGPSVPRGHEPHPLEQRTLLDEAPHERSIAPEALLHEMVQRFENTKQALLSVWRAWQAVEPVVQRVEERQHALDETIARLGLTSGSIDGLVALRAEVARLRTQAARDPLAAPADIEARLAPRFQILEASVASLTPRHKQAEERLLRARQRLTELQQRHKTATERASVVLRQLALGPEAPALSPAIQPLSALATALDELTAPGAWIAANKLERWFAAADSLQSQIEQLDSTTRRLQSAGPELAGRFSARRAQLRQFQTRGYLIPAELLRCVRTLEELLSQAPLPVGRIASYMDLLDKAMSLPLLLLILFGAPVLAGCRREPRPPTEEAYVASSAVVPGLTSPKKSGGAALNGHLGDVYLAHQNWGHHDWTGEIEGQKLERHDALLMAKRSPRDGISFIFAGDYQPRVPVPTTEWICSTTPRPAKLGSAACPEVLYRIWIDQETTVAYPPCSNSPCLLGLIKKGKATWSDVNDLVSVEHRKLGGLSILVVLQNHHKEKENGLRVVFLGVTPGLPELASSYISLINSATPSKSVYRSTKISFPQDTIVIEGAEREVDLQEKKELASRPIREVFRPAGATLRRE